MRIAVFGAGYAGITVARRLRRRLPEANLVVVDEDGTHLVQHELHRIVRRPGLADHIELPLADLLPEADCRRARVADLDPEGRTATLADGSVVEYDVGAVCLGGSTEFYDIEGVEAHATPLKRLSHARRIRETFLEDVGDGRVLVGGAGLSGIQVAGELAALADDLGRSARVTLVEQRDAVAPTFDPQFQGAVRQALAAEGVEIRTGTAITSAEPDALALADGERLPYDQLVWTGGIRGTAALNDDRPRVRATMRLADRTFALGDAAEVVDATGTVVPATAQAAVKEAEVVARNVVRIAEGDDVFDPRLEQFEFDARGWVVSVGDRTVAQVGSSVLTGRAAKVVKATLSARHLTGVGAVRDAVDVVASEFGVSAD